jgi:hypothetical protein
LTDKNKTFGAISPSIAHFLNIFKE